jgi:hypothetical protein
VYSLARNITRQTVSLSVTEEDWLVALEVVDSDKLRWAIKEDGIFTALLKNRIEILSGQLVEIFKACLALGYIPKAWQKVRAIFISHRVDWLSHFDQKVQHCFFLKR